MKQKANLVFEQLYSIMQYSSFINRETNDKYFQYNILCLYRVSISSFFSLLGLLKLLKK